MGLQDFIEDEKSIDTQVQDTSSEKKSEDDPDEEEVDGPSRFALLNDYSSDGEYRGPWPDSEGVDPRELDPDEELPYPGWVDKTEDFRRYTKDHHGRVLHMKSVQCDCGRTHARSANQAGFRCINCSSIIIDRDAPRGCYETDSGLSPNVSELWDDRTGFENEAKRDRVEESMRDSQTEDDETQTGLQTFRGGS